MSVALGLHIKTHCPKFTSAFKLVNFADDYTCFRYSNQWNFCEVHIIKTSQKCYRVIVYCSFSSRADFANYVSFRSAYDLYDFLESTAKAVLNK